MFFRQKDSELEELRRQVAELKKEYSGLASENDGLINDAKACSRHLDLLTNEHFSVKIFTQNTFY